MTENKTFLFTKKNYSFMLLGIGVIILGFALMAISPSEDPSVFKEEIFDFQRIRLAPSLILIGFGIEIYAIFMNPTKNTI